MATYEEEQKEYDERMKRAHEEDEEKNRKGAEDANRSRNN